jgi:hypothetical protein
MGIQPVTVRPVLLVSVEDYPAVRELLRRCPALAHIELCASVLLARGQMLATSRKVLVKDS